MSRASTHSDVTRTAAARNASHFPPAGSLRSLFDAGARAVRRRCPDRFIGTLPYAQHHRLHRTPRVVLAPSALCCLPGSAGVPGLLHVGPRTSLAQHGDLIWSSTSPSPSVWPASSSKGAARARPRKRETRKASEPASAGGRGIGVVGAGALAVWAPVRLLAHADDGRPGNKTEMRWGARRETDG